MIKIGDKKITVAMAREFFKVTESKPKDLIAWLNRARKMGKRNVPCANERYKGDMIFIGSIEGVFKKSIDREGWIGKPVRFPDKLGNPLEIWRSIKDNKKEFQKFIKFLRRLKL